MTELSFTARACFVGELEDSDTFVIALADDAENPQQTFELQKPLDRAEQGYATVLTSGSRFEGGLRSHALQNDQLILDYADDAQKALGISRIRVKLDLDPLVIDQIRSGLQTLLS